MPTRGACPQRTVGPGGCTESKSINDISRDPSERASKESSRRRGIATRSTWDGQREGIRGHRGGRKRVRSRPVVRSEAALAIYICRQHNMPHYRFWDLGLKGQALRQIRAPSELAPWVQARGWREIAFFRFFSLPAPAATDPPANFIHTLTNHSQGPGSNAWHSMSQH